MGKGKYQDWLTQEGLTKLEGWARDGLTDEQIANNIGIGTTTLYNWKKRYVEIVEALKKGKEVVDREVEGSLLRRAKGYTTVDHQYKVVDVDPDVLHARRRKVANTYKLDHPEATKQEIDDYAAEKVPTRESIELFQNQHEVPPDTTAAIFWLKNRKPDEWRDRKETELSGGVGVQVSDPYKNLSEEQLAKLADDDDG